MPWPFSCAKMAEMFSIGIDTWRATPPKRASNSSSSLPMVSRLVATAEMFSTISPLRTNSRGTTVRSSTATAM